ncbi:glutathione synthase [[Limnothrix rosea] IAM M-220]|uniref:glutathione synthase n=1 Tax=[Limnothrix rosea] IAM M-220 TaxID=454133 RepID=UPI0009608B33|nr:glutathione synthase [[Limnothrix rosea] IAM M-220]OKH13442.1 glutathione synthase [[Limnothrix rosea] IAM M-220]
MKFAFILDPIAKLDPGHDTTVAFMEAAQQLGHEVWITQIEDLSIIKNQAWATLQAVTLNPVKLIDGLWRAEKEWFELGEKKLMPLTEMQAVFMRKDPPVDTPYLYATYILDLVDPTKTLVVNNPQGIRAANEKVYALNFGDVIPTTIVTSQKSVVREFVEEKGAAVIKPLGGKAGEGILFLPKGDRNFNSLLEISTKQGTEPVMVQEFLPAAKDGDKRLIVLDGEPIGAVNRIPTGDDFRGNMAVGGRIAQVDITERDRHIAATVAPKLKEDGLYFVGLDIIGGNLTEVNVTSPTGVREADRLDGLSLGKKVMEWTVAEVNSL